MASLPLPRYCGDHGGDVLQQAADFADRDAEQMEALVTALTAEAIGRWRLDDATFWQRVRFRTRMIRATLHGAERAALEGESAC